MIHVGVDIGKEHHCAVAIDDCAQRLMKPWVFSQTLEDYAELERRMDALGPRDQIRIGIEQTGHYGDNLIAYLLARGWNVETYNPLVSAAMARGNIRGTKSDPEDAFAGACVVRDRRARPAREMEADLRAAKQMSRERCALAEQLGSIKQRLGSLVDVVFPEFAQHFGDPYGVTALAVLEAYPSAQAVAKAHLRSLTSTIENASRKQLGRSCALKLRASAQTSVAQPSQVHGRDQCIGLIMTQIRFLKQHIKTLDQMIDQRLEHWQHHVRSVPGVGVRTGPTILAEFAAFAPFDSGRLNKKMLAFAGSDPKLRTSGKWKGKVKMTKRGSRTLRTALYQAANIARQKSEPFKAVYERQIRKGKPFKVAISHVMRKLIDVIAAVLRDSQPYDPLRVGVDRSAKGVTGVVIVIQ